MANLRDIYWDMLLVQDMELWEILMIVSKMKRFLERVRVQLWESHLLQNAKLVKVLLVSAQMGGLMANLRDIHCEILLP